MESCDNNVSKIFIVTVTFKNFPKNYQKRKKKKIRIESLTVFPYQFYLYKVQGYIFYQAFLSFINSV